MENLVILPVLTQALKTLTLPATFLLYSTSMGLFMPLRDCPGQPHCLWPQDPSIPSLPLPQAGEEPADHIPVCVPEALGSQRRDHGPVGRPWWAQRAAGERGLEREPGRGAPSRILHLGCHRR